MNMNMGRLSFDTNRLETLIFSPIEKLPTAIDNSFINNLDPDKHL